MAYLARLCGIIAHDLLLRRWLSSAKVSPYSRYNLSVQLHVAPNLYCSNYTSCRRSILHGLLLYAGEEGSHRHTATIAEVLCNAQLDGRESCAIILSNDTTGIFKHGENSLMRNEPKSRIESLSSVSVEVFATLRRKETQLGQFSNIRTRARK